MDFDRRRQKSPFHRGRTKSTPTAIGSVGPADKPADPDFTAGLDRRSIRSTAGRGAPGRDFRHRLRPLLSGTSQRSSSAVCRRGRTARTFRQEVAHLGNALQRITLRLLQGSTKNPAYFAVAGLPSAKTDLLLQRRYQRLRVSPDGRVLVGPEFGSSGTAQIQASGLAKLGAGSESYQPQAQSARC